MPPPTGNGHDVPRKNFAALPEVPEYLAAMTSVGPRPGGCAAWLARY